MRELKENLTLFDAKIQIETFRKLAQKFDYKSLSQMKNWHENSYFQRRVHFEIFSAFVEM